MRRGVRGLLIVMGCQPWAVVGQPLVEPSRLERPWRPNGGVIAAGQRVAGTPWTEWTLGLWGQSPWAPLDEWSVGASLEGGGPWVSMEGQCGGRMTLTPTTSVQWMGALGMSSWPELGQRAMALGLQMWTDQRTTWGDLRFDVRMNLGQSQRRAQRSLDGNLLLGGNPWEWQMWWWPKQEHPVVGMPALGWSTGGAWFIAWSPEASWWRGMRLWAPPTGRVFFQWVMPDGRFELSWRATLASRCSGRPSSTSAPALKAAKTNHALGALVRQRPRFTGWSWNWSWERVTLTEKHP